MLRIGIIDANEKSSSKFKPEDIVSHVAQWLKWEVERAGMRLVPVENADLVFFCYAGALGWAKAFRREARRYHFSSYNHIRHGEPYVIGGGAVETIPFTALSHADAISVGEAFHFVRDILAMVKANKTIRDIRRYVVEYDHALEWSQIDNIGRDEKRYWLLERAPAPLASPDTRIDWTIPPILGPDNVMRIMASKGCRWHCKFCATSYRQPYAVDPDTSKILRTLAVLKRRGERSVLVTNDVSDLPYFDRLPKFGALDSQSLSYRTAKDRETLRAVVQAGAKVMRFGVEGISERIRRAIGKPIPGGGLLDLLHYLLKTHTQPHMFFIVGMPYEDDSDYAAFREWYTKLAHVADWGLIRIKYTTFQPYPPTPLARFVQGRIYYQRMLALKDWIPNNVANRHLFPIWGCGNETFIRDWADIFTLSCAEVEPIQQEIETVDLAPTLDDARRMPWEIIQWPFSVAKRWELGNVYKRKVGQ